MRRTVVLTVVFSVAAIAWLILDADPEGRRELVNRISNAFSEPEEQRVPNWGDVATKVGEFTEEERALREVLNPALSGDQVEPGETPAAPDPG